METHDDFQHYFILVFMVNLAEAFQYTLNKHTWSIKAMLSNIQLTHG